MIDDDVPALLTLFIDNSGTLGKLCRHVPYLLTHLFYSITCPPTLTLLITKSLYLLKHYINAIDGIVYLPSPSNPLLFSFPALAGNDQST